MKRNDQVILKQDAFTSTLKVHSIFKTIQGEGPFAGEPAVFIRLYGCNLQCPLCDTDYTSQYVDVNPEAILIAVSAFLTPNKLVVITGGEPFRQDIGPSVRLLLKAKIRVQIETNGTLYLRGFPYWNLGVTIVCSPKTGKVNKKLALFIDAYKYVLHADTMADDGLPIRALDHETGSKRVARQPDKGMTWLPLFG